MARERSIVVRLKAEISDYQSKMGAASRSLSEFEKAQQGMGGAATTTMGRLVQSAKINQQEWSTVGRTLAVTGGAVAAVGVAALKTGISYNTLQQTSRAALTTLTGSAEAANAQMDKLDEFAKGSPFAKDVFIRAQQQMLGFGIEAKKVIPYLDSIQDAVAATGGSNQDIAELTRIFSQVQAAAKITATDLMQFGQRGVDAASLIGSQMGMTGAEIREEITAGTLDAGTALDALAAGMKATYGGAADNVKETFAGAIDRVKAAWRDLSAALAEPLVGKEGGGLAVAGLNKLADAMRAFEGAPTWVKGGVVAIGALTSATALAGGAFALALPRWVEFRTALTTLGAAHPALAKLDRGISRFGGTIGRLAGKGAIIGGITLAVGGLLSAASNSAGIRGLNAIQREIRGIADAGQDAANTDLSAFLTDMPTLFGVNKIEAQNLGDVIDSVLNMDAGDRISDFFGGIFPTYMRENRDILEGVDEALTSMLAAGGLDESQAVAFIEALGLSTEDLARVLPGAADAMVGMEEAAEGAAGGASTLAEGTDEAAAAAEAAAEKMQAWTDTLLSASESFGGILEAYDAVIAKNDELGTSTAVTMEDWIAELKAHETAVREWRQNYGTALDQIKEEVPAAGQEAHRAFVEEMVAAGEGGAEALQTFVNGTPAQRQELVDAWLGAGEEVQQMIEDGTKPIPMDVDTSLAIANSQALMGDWEDTTTDTGLSADVTDAVALADALQQGWKDTTTETMLSIDPMPADRVFNAETGRWESIETATGLGLDPSAARVTYDMETGRWEYTTTDTNLDANTSPAKSAFGGVTDNWAQTTTRTNLDLNDSAARTSFWNFKSWLGGQTLSKTMVVSTREKGAYEGGWIAPGLRDGGFVPGPRAGYDNVAWPLYAGGRVMTQPLEGGEFVVRSSIASQYPQLLTDLNAGKYSGGVRNGGFAASSAGITINLHGVPMDQAAEVANAVSFEMRRAGRGGVHNGRGA